MPAINKVDDGFYKGQSDNLPKVDVLMIAEFFRTNDCFNLPEIRGVKEDRVGRESYGDAAIGYVQVRREQELCTVKCKICPEHRVREKNYTVLLQVNENQNKVDKVECLDCAASTGGCKHAIAVLMWIHRRSEEPAPTEVQCYWKKSKLSRVGTSLKFITVSAFGGTPVEDDDGNFLNEAMGLGVQQKSEGEMFKLFSEPKFSCLNLYTLLLKFVENNGFQYKDFIVFCKQNMSQDLCKEAASTTMMQAEDSLWHRLRFGRITASKLYGAAHCKKECGTFVQQLIGVTKLRDTKAMKRGRLLEKEVLQIVEKNLNSKFSSVGIVLSKDHPIFGASPDAVFENFVVEVKCPSSEKTVSNYLTSKNKVTAKYMAQIQLQMHILQKRSCIFAVADPDFENNKKVNFISVMYNKDTIIQIMADAENFWEKNVFPILLKSAQK